MRDLITDLLESERLAGGGHAALNTETSDLNALVAEVIDSRFAGDVNVELDSTLPPVPLDRTRIRLLLRNLIDNALRHSSPEGTPAAPTVTTLYRDDRIVLRVRDHGPGVDEAQLAHLGEAFYRTDSARQRSTGGFGLGLYLCRLVAQAHGGTLAARNAQPGLEVEVTLPLRGQLPAQR